MTFPNAEVIGFTGTRKGMTDLQKEAVTRVLAYLRPKRVLHGGCVGADADFHETVRATLPDTTIHIYPSNLPSMRAKVQGDWEAAPMAPLKRNHEIVLRVPVLVVCPAEYHEVRRSGTWATVRDAAGMGRLIVMAAPDGSTTIGGEPWNTT